MASIREIHSFEISAPWLQVPVTVASYTQIGDATYIKLAKSCPKTIRLLSGEGIGIQRKLTNTGVLERIATLRNAEHDRMCLAAEAVVAPAAVDDLGLDAEPVELPAKRQKAVRGALAETMTINLPPVGDHGGMSIKALTARGHEPLWVEMNSSCIDYLREAAKHDMTKETKASDPRFQSPRPRVYWSKQKNAWRALHSEDGKNHRRMSKPGSLTDEAIKASASEAFASVQSHV